MKIVFLTLLICFAGLMDLHAQQVSVIDAASKQPLEGVAVSDGLQKKILTNAKGKADIAKLSDAKSVTFSLSGYQSVTTGFDALRADSFLVSMTQKIFNMSEVTVAGTRPQSAASKSPSSVNALSSRDFYRGSEVYLQNTLNTVPGVRMEMRSSTSQSDIRIRGLGGKSRFNLRDIRVYYNGLPLTEADGTTTLDGLDFSAFGSGQVIKGPTSILYGSGTAGAIVFNTKKARYQELDLNEVMTLGADGLLRSNTNYRSGTENSNIYVSYGSQSYDGYREHSASQKNFLTLSGDFFPGENQTLSVLAIGTSTNDDFPGELNAAQYASDPRMANPAYVAKNIGIRGKTFYSGVNYGYNFTPEIESSFSVFLGNSNNNQPIEPFVDLLSLTKGGVRSVLSYTNYLDGMQTNLVAGTEIIRNVNTERHYAISALGAQGALNFDRDYDLVSYVAFLQGTLAATNRTSVSAGFRVNGAHYIINDNLKPGGNDFSGMRNIMPYVTPLLSVVQTMNDQLTLYGIFSGGFSAPTTNEISLANGAINSDLQPEKTLNYEVGARGNFLDSKFAYTASLFDIRLTDSYVPQLVNGVSYLVNAGKSESRGIELYGAYDLSFSDIIIRNIHPFISLSYTDFKYVDYVNNGSDFSGNKFPGVAPVLFDAGVDISSPAGIYFNFTYMFTDKRMITDDNSIADPSYSIANIKGGWRKRLAKSFTLHISGGIDNATGTHYSPTIALNQTTAPGTMPLYYNPAPGANPWVALNIEFHFAE